MRALAVNNLNNNSNANDRNNLNNNARFVRITQAPKAIMMENPDDFFGKICSYSNLELAFKRARKGKTQKQYVTDFEKNLEENLFKLRFELLFHTYKPKPLETFILRDPKTRRISKSDFRDRIVHHALCNVIEQVFEKRFIYDSYANRIGKGSLKAIERFDFFKRKASKNNTLPCYVLKADIKHYFDNVNHSILIDIIRKKITDKRVIWLIKRILSNYSLDCNGKSMPLGNLTSQFFANVYLNELDQFVKHKLKAQYYIRYV
ncbi:MAG: reverse transcriptase domain-containing protein, partial [Candidatus Woesearchaeota archaeon]